MAFEKHVENIIHEAIERGEFDHLAGAGRPIDLSTYFNTPAEIRATYTILKNAGILPREAELLHEIADLNENMSNLADKKQRQEISQQIQRKRIEFSLLMERNHK